MKYFKEALTYFKNYKQNLGFAKATFLRAQFIFDYSDTNNLSKELEALIIPQLKEIDNVLIQNKNYQIIAESNIIQSQIYLQQ